MNACEKKSESLLKKPDIRPDIRYPVTSGYPAGYPNPDFQNPDIRVSGTTLGTFCFSISIKHLLSDCRKYITTPVIRGYSAEKLFM